MDYRVPVIHKFPKKLEALSKLYMLEG
jgi:hypothetical protein